MIETEGASRFRVLDCWINCVDMPKAAEYVSDRIGTGEGGYVCFSNVHTVVTARRDARLKEATNNSLLSVADGKPLSLLAKMRGIADVSQVAGPDFLPYFFQSVPGARHYFYGSTEDTLEKLLTNLRSKFPESKIVGHYAPPFRDLTRCEKARVVETITQAKPDVIWVGLGAPKQECWMADNWVQLKPAILMGVGAAFDIHAGKILRAPAWVRRLSMEWLYRLSKEPRRLWKRYLITNFLFVYYLFKSETDNIDSSQRKP